MVIYTVGHSNHAIGHFIGLLLRHEVKVVADVRSTPFSRFNPQFNRERLQGALEAAGIRYVFLGEELGARAQDPALYEDGRVSYAKLAATPAFGTGLDRLEAEMQTARVSLMCAERDPLQCHRTILVSRELTRQRGIAVTHILQDGSLETGREASQRLVETLKLPRDDLFYDEAALFEAAFDKQGQRVAYSVRPVAGEAPPAKGRKAPGPKPL